MSCNLEAWNGVRKWSDVQQSWDVITGLQQGYMDDEGLEFHNPYAKWSETYCYRMLKQYKHVLEALCWKPWLLNKANRMHKYNSAQKKSQTATQLPLRSLWSSVI